MVMADDGTVIEVEGYTHPLFGDRREVPGPVQVTHWTSQEDEAMEDLVAELGAKWTEISRQLSDQGIRRTAKAVKNRWSKLYPDNTCPQPWQYHQQQQAAAARNAAAVVAAASGGSAGGGVGGVGDGGGAGAGAALSQAPPPQELQQQAQAAAAAAAQLGGDGQLTPGGHTKLTARKSAVAQGPAGGAINTQGIGLGLAAAPVPLDQPVALGGGTVKQAARKSSVNQPGAGQMIGGADGADPTITGGPTSSF
jgi:hypothetical protein